MKATHKPRTVVPITPADLLRMAALYLARHGWTQGDFYTVVFNAVTPRACVSGAIGMAAYGTVVDTPPIHDCPERRSYADAVYALGDYLDLIHGMADVFTWNDTPGRTAAEVIDALNDAADQWDILHPRGGEPA